MKHDETNSRSIETPKLHAKHQCFAPRFWDLEGKRFRCEGSMNSLQDLLRPVVGLPLWELCRRKLRPVLKAPIGQIRSMGFNIPTFGVLCQSALLNSKHLKPSRMSVASKTVCLSLLLGKAYWKSIGSVYLKASMHRTISKKCIELRHVCPQGVLGATEWPLLATTEGRQREPWLKTD